MKVEIPVSCRRFVQTELQLNVIKKKNNSDEMRFFGESMLYFNFAVFVNVQWYRRSFSRFSIYSLVDGQLELHVDDVAGFGGWREGIAAGGW